MKLKLNVLLMACALALGSMGVAAAEPPKVLGKAPYGRPDHSRPCVYDGQECKLGNSTGSYGYDNKGKCCKEYNRFTCIPKEDCCHEVTYCRDKGNGGHGGGGNGGYGD